MCVCVCVCVCERERERERNWRRELFVTDLHRCSSSPKLSVRMTPVGTTLGPAAGGGQGQPPHDGPATGQ